MAQAERLETLVPGAGHLVHMPAHIYIRTGQYAKSAKSNADAALLDEKYVKETGANGLYPTMYYGHNLQFESAAAMMSRQPRRGACGGGRPSALVDPDGRRDGPMLQPFTLQDALALVRFEPWDEVLALPAPPPDARRCRRRSLISCAAPRSRARDKSD